MMKLTFAQESVKAVWGEFMQLAEAHWKETEGYRHNQPFQPDARRYAYYEELGNYFFFTARDDAGRMVGNAGMYVMPSMHTGELVATEDTWYLTPVARMGRNAIRFYQFVEDRMRALNCVDISMTVKLSNGAGRILEYLDYAHVASQYTKSLRA